MKFRMLALLMQLLLCSAAVSAQLITGKVVAIADGDTVTVLDVNRTQRKIRLNGIDAPESGQAFGQASKRNLSALIFGKAVEVRYNKTDRYGRVLGLVLLDGRDINLEQLRAGFAWFYRAYERDVDPARRRSYADVEQEARQARRGLWTDPNPQPPWEFRHPQRTGPSGATSPSSAPGGGRVIGNRNSRIYHLQNCPDYSKVSERNRIYFGTEAEAQQAGFRKARNCP